MGGLVAWGAMVGPSSTHVLLRGGGKRSLANREGVFFSPAAIDETYADVVAVEHLVTGEVDGMVIGMRQFGIDQWGGLSMFCGQVAPVVGGQLLFDDIGLDSDAEVVGLAGEVGGRMIIHAIHLKACISGITPQDGGHTQLMGLFKGFRDLL